MASKEAALRHTIDEQSGEIEVLQKSNKRLKEELFAGVSQRHIYEIWTEHLHEL